MSRDTILAPSLTPEAIDALLARLNAGDAVRCESEHLDALAERDIFPVSARNRQRLGIYGEWVAWIPRKARNRADLDTIRLSRTGQPVDAERKGDFCVASPTEAVVANV